MGNKTTTSWILEFVDEITKPLKGATKSIVKSTSFIDDMTDSVKLNEKETKEALNNAKNHYADLKKQISENAKELKELEKAKKSDSWSEVMEATKAFDKATLKAERLRDAIQGAEKDVQDLSSESDKFAKKAQKWSDVTTGINQATELMQKGVDGLNFTTDTSNLTTAVQRMTDLAGNDLENFVTKTQRLTALYGEDALEIARAANAMTKQNGGTFEDNLALIDQGFQKGANANGDFIDSLKEYQPFIKQLGLDQSQAIALIAKAGKQGIFSDKAIDGIKEADLSLREMGKAQVEALKGIGIKPDELIGKTTFEAVQMISQKMKGATTQAKQLILADIFKGAGEDAGLMWAQELGSANFNLADLPSVKESAEGMKTFFSDIKTWAGSTFSNMGSYAETLSPIIMTIGSAIPIINSLKAATWFQTIAQWNLNAAMDANPIGVIVIAIIALIALVTAVIMKYDEWGAAVTLLMGPLGMVINLIQSFRRNWDSIVQAFKTDGIIGGIKRIGIVILDALLMPIQQLLELIAKIPGMGGIAGGAANWIKEQRQKLNLVTEEKKAPEKKSEKKPGVNSLLQQPPDVLGKTAGATGKGKKGAKEGDGLNVGSGSGGIKNITMTLNIANNFSVSQGMDVRQIAEKITGEINDRLRDGVISLG